MSNLEMGNLEMSSIEIDEQHPDRRSYVGDFVDDLNVNSVANRSPQSKDDLPIPNDALSCLVLGATRVQIGDLLAGVAYYDRAIELDPELAIAYNSRGSLRLHLLYDREAIEDYDRAIELEPDNPEFYSNRGMARSLSGEMQEAIADFKQAIALYQLQGDRSNSRKLETFLSTLYQQYRL